MAKSSALGRLQQALSSRVSGEVTQFAEKVVNFSSQYGTDGSASYVAANLAGNLRVYNKYGDFTEAFVLVCFTYTQVLHTGVDLATFNYSPRPHAPCMTHPPGRRVGGRGGGGV